MTEPLQVGQFGIVDHEPVDRSPNAGIFQGKGPPGDRAELFVVAEGTTPAGEAFAGHVVSGVGQSWANLDMSVTGAVRRVFLEAERNVRDWNQKSVAQHRVNLGMSCFARKGPHMVVAQAGPTVAFHLGGGTVTAYMPEGEAHQPIGSDAPVQPQINRIDLRPGDRLLIFSTAALAEVDEELVTGILNLPGMQALQDLYRRVEHLRHLTVVLIEAPPEAESPAIDEREEAQAAPPNGGDEPIIGGPSAIRARKALQPSLFVDALDEERHRSVEEARERLTHLPPRPSIRPVSLDQVEQALAPLQRAVGDRDFERLAAHQRERASESRLAAAAASAVAASTHDLPSWRTRTSANGRAVVIGAETSRDSHGNGTTPPGAAERPLNSAAENVAAPGSSFARSLVRGRSHPKPDPSVSDAPLASDIVALQRSAAPRPIHPRKHGGQEYAAAPLVRPRRGMGRRWRGNGALSRRTVTAVQAPSTRMVVAIGLVMLLGLVAILSVPRLLSTDTDARVAELMASAQRQLTAAHVQDDPAQRRSLLTEAQALALEAEQVGGTTTETHSLVNEIGAEIALLDAVMEPALVETIASLEAYGDRTVTPADISIGPAVAYLMDTNGEQVIAQPLDGSSASTIYRIDGETGQARPVALTYYTSPLDAGGGRLFVADTGGVLWAYTPETGVQRVELNMPSGAQLTDIATYNGELYILDAGAGRIYRMTGIDGSFPYEPQVVREGPELRSAVRMMVEDEIVTASADGSLRRYSGELALDLSQAGIDRHLSQPAAPWLTDDGYIAIADLAGNRVAIFHPDGTFVRQYRHNGFADMAAMGMRDGVAYVFAKGRLLRVTFSE